MSQTAVILIRKPFSINVLVTIAVLCVAVHAKVKFRGESGNFADIQQDDDQKSFKTSLGHTFPPSDHDPSDSRHYGDLYITHQSRVHSLAWTIDLKGSCDISDVIGSFKIPRDGMSPNNGASQSKWEQSSEVPLDLVLLKKVLPFGNTFLIAHPYFRLFNSIERRNILKYKQLILKKHHFSTIIDDLQSHNSSGSISNDYVLDRRKNLSPLNIEDRSQYLKHILFGKSRHELFLDLQKYMSTYLGSHPCVLDYRQEVLKRRVKRSKPHFQDPLYYKQWHLVAKLQR